MRCSDVSHFSRLFFVLMAWRSQFSLSIELEFGFDLIYCITCHIIISFYESYNYCIQNVIIYFNLDIQCEYNCDRNDSQLTNWSLITIINHEFWINNHCVRQSIVCHSFHRWTSFIGHSKRVIFGGDHTKRFALFELSMNCSLIIWVWSLSSGRLIIPKPLQHRCHWPYSWKPWETIGDVVLTSFRVTLTHHW